MATPPDTGWLAQVLRPWQGAHPCWLRTDRAPRGWPTPDAMPSTGQVCLSRWWSHHYGLPSSATLLRRLSDEAAASWLPGTAMPGALEPALRQAGRVACLSHPGVANLWVRLPRGTIDPSSIDDWREAWRMACARRVRRVSLPAVQAWPTDDELVGLGVRWFAHALRRRLPGLWYWLRFRLDDTLAIDRGVGGEPDDALPPEGDDADAVQFWSLWTRRAQAGPTA